MNISKLTRRDKDKDQKPKGKRRSESELRVANHPRSFQSVLVLVRNVIIVSLCFNFNCNLLALLTIL